MGTRENGLDEAVLTSTHNLCFGANISKIGMPLHTPVLLYKRRVQGVIIARTCFLDVIDLAAMLQIRIRLLVAAN